MRIRTHIALMLRAFPRFSDVFVRFLTMQPIARQVDSLVAIVTVLITVLVASVYFGVESIPAERSADYFLEIGWVGLAASVTAAVIVVFWGFKEAVSGMTVLGLALITYMTCRVFAFAAAAMMDLSHGSDGWRMVVGLLTSMSLLLILILTSWAGVDIAMASEKLRRMKTPGT